MTQRTTRHHVSRRIFYCCCFSFPSFYSPPPPPTRPCLYETLVPFTLDIQQKVLPAKDKKASESICHSTFFFPFFSFVVCFCCCFPPFFSPFYFFFFPPFFLDVHARALLRSSEHFNRKPTLECVNGQQPPSKTPVGVLP